MMTLISLVLMAFYAEPRVETDVDTDTVTDSASLRDEMPQKPRARRIVY